MFGLLKKPKLLLIIDDNFGSLGEALYLLKGLSYRVSLLVPEKLYRLNRRKLPFPLHVYRSRLDIERAVLQQKPDLVFLFSAYLLCLTGNFATDDIYKLAEFLESQPVMTVTADPFLNAWGALDMEDPGYDPLLKGALSVFTSRYRYFRRYIHVTPLRLINGRNITHFDYYNYNVRITPAERARYSQTASAHLHIDRRTPFWLFFLAGAEYVNQTGGDEISKQKGVKSRAPYFHALIMNRLREAVTSGRTGVLIAPAACIEAVKKMAGPETGRIIFISFCDFNIYTALFFAAELVFSWNIFSFSLLPRVLNQLPVFFFSRGHISSLHRDFFVHLSGHFPGCRIDVVHPGKKLEVDALQQLASHQERRLYRPLHHHLSRSEGPERLVGRLLETARLRCRVCGHSGRHRTYQVREMMFGSRDAFSYSECSKCGCLQIEEIPAHMSRYYPHRHHRFLSPPEMEKNPEAAAIRDRQLRSLDPLPITPESRILEVGCGSGCLLYRLRQRGYRHLAGLDPFIAADIDYGGGLTIRRGTVADLAEAARFDLIMFQDSFPCFADPLELLRRCRRLLSAGGVCLMSMPTVSSYAWGYYRVDWAELDAPRSLLIQSDDSLKLLAAAAGLSVEDIVYDSTDFQFWGSEQYKKDIPLYSPRSLFMNPENGLFSPEEIELFDRKADRLNREKQGDRVIVRLKKPA